MKINGKNKKLDINVKFVGLNLRGVVHLGPSISWMEKVCKRSTTIWEFTGWLTSNWCRIIHMRFMHMTYLNTCVCKFSRGIHLLTFMKATFIKCGQHPNINQSYKIKQEYQYIGNCCKFLLLGNIMQIDQLPGIRTDKSPYQMAD